MGSSESKSSFAMGLSIAEVFLLLIFATFIYFGKLSESLGAPDRSLPVRIAEIMVRLEKLEYQNEALATQNDDLKSENDHLNDLLDEIINTMNLEYSPKMKDAIKKGDSGAIRQFKDDLDDRLIRRVRLCAEENTLITVRANSSGSIATIASNAEKLFKYLDKKLGESFKVGHRIDWENISPFLKAVFQYETQENCRYFYNLEWERPEDFLLNDQLEKYLYKGKSIRVEQQ